jgi:hypothetical protein
VRERTIVRDRTERRPNVSHKFPTLGAPPETHARADRRFAQFSAIHPIWHGACKASHKPADAPLVRFKGRHSHVRQLAARQRSDRPRPSARLSEPPFFSRRLSVTFATSTHKLFGAVSALFASLLLVSAAIGPVLPLA